MHITREKDKDVEIFRLDGRFDAHSASDVEKALQQAVDEGCGKIIMDMEKTEYISSAGLRVLLSMTKKLKSSEGNICLCCLQQQVQEVFDIAGFTQILDIAGSIQEAMSKL